MPYCFNAYSGTSYTYTSNIAITPVTFTNAAALFTTTTNAYALHEFSVINNIRVATMDI